MTKPVLDEQTLDKLLEAAFVLQEHNRQRRELELHLETKRDQLEANDRAAAESDSSKTPAQQAAHQTDYTLTLGKIVETQHQIQVRQLDLDHAISLVADRVIEISGASGSAIGLINGQSVRYRAASGRKTLAAGIAVPVKKALSFPCIESGQVLRCPDANLNTAIDTEECRRRGIQSLIAAPVFHDGDVAGALELYYASPHAFTDQDVHSCQLMAGLVTEALVRDEELTWKQSLASERAAMLQALEKLEPNLAALVEKPAAKKEPPVASPLNVAPALNCRNCGHQLLAEEQFCGECGVARSTDYEPPSMQSKVASLWHMQEAQNKEHEAVVEKEGVSPQSERDSVHPHFETSLAHALDHPVPEVSPASRISSKEATANEPATLLHSEEEQATSSDDSTTPEEDHASDTTAIQKLTRPADWSSAASARAFLEQLASGKRSRSLAHFWNTRRGDIYLAIAVILVGGVIRWGMWSNHSASATGGQTPAASTHKKAPDVDLSLFDRMLIQLGLAEAPETTEDKGNPAAQVWVDQRTALYYCPGADLYGKTPKGKFTSQREAQLDQFEPAYRKTCN